LDLIRSAWSRRPEWRLQLRPALSVLLCDDDPDVRRGALQLVNGALGGSLASRLKVRELKL
jgi:hypothetical protein